MEKAKAILNRMFLLPPLPTVLLAIFGYGAVIAVFAVKSEIPALRIASYLASAYALVITITGVRYVKPVKDRIKKHIDENPLVNKFRSTVIGERLLTDPRFRAGLILYSGFLINLMYIVMELASGIAYRSAWFLSLAAYYALLALMRMMVVRRVSVRDERIEWLRYRLCGVMLLLMNQALAGIVVFVVHRNRGFDYPGPLIYGMALYSFYAAIFATVSIFRTRRYKSPLLSAAKAISLVAAMVSVLSLETAMLARFGGDDDPMFRQVMTGATGGCICTIVIVMAVYMILRANRNMRMIENNRSQT